MRRSMCNRLAIGLVLLGVVGWAGSVRGQSSPASAAQPGSEADVQMLRERAAAFWAARVAGDAQGQWQLLEPRGKGRLTAQEYGADMGGGRYLAYQVEGATVNGLFATVKVKVLVQQVLPPSSMKRSIPPQATVVDDGWIRVGGVWYRRLDAGAVQARQPDGSGD
jgi:hypothetical protein